MTFSNDFPCAVMEYATAGGKVLKTALLINLFASRLFNSLESVLSVIPSISFEICLKRLGPDDNENKINSLLQKQSILSFWVAQIILAAFFITGAVMKFQSIEKISAMMPWTGQVPAAAVRLPGIIDLLGAIGLILPALLRIKPRLTPWAAIGIIVLMLCAIIFHVSRGEAAVTGVNIFCVFIAIFIVWGGFSKAPIAAK